MLARGYNSDTGSQRFDSIMIDMSTRKAAGQITFEQFHNMSIVQRTELFSKYPDIYTLLSVAEKGVSHGRYTGQMRAPQ